MSSEHLSHARTYIILWAVLLAALVASLLIPASNATMVAAIFGISTVKALIVINYYMHLNKEPSYLQVAFYGTVGLMVFFCISLMPDVGFGWSVVAPTAVAAEGELKPPSAERGAKVYAANCQACHQADGTGRIGTLQMAASFVEDTERMAKSDEELLQSIANGKKGAIGQMPPWAAILSEQQRVDALAYIREHYGAKSH